MKRRGLTCLALLALLLWCAPAQAQITQCRTAPPGTSSSNCASEAFVTQSIAAAIASLQTIGTWTPVDASGAGLSFTATSAAYTQIGNMVFAYAQLSYPVTADASAAMIGGLPVTLPNQAYARQCSVTRTTVGSTIELLPSQTLAQMVIRFTNGASVTNANMSASNLNLICVYPAT